ncbi:UNVERIFIED_ORG: hypothetical protein C7432_0330 [Pantoea allii]
MKEIIESIKRSLESKNYQAALFISLSIPDICGQIEHVGIRNGDGARQWFDKYLAPRYHPKSLYEAMLISSPDYIAKLGDDVIQAYKAQPPTVTFTSQQFWELRNAFLHNASSVGKKLTVHLTHSVSHMNLTEGVLQLSAIALCNDIIQAAEKWMQDMGAYPDVMKRISETVQVKNSIADKKIQYH